MSTTVNLSISKMEIVERARILKDLYAGDLSHDTYANIRYRVIDGGLYVMGSEFDDLCDWIDNVSIWGSHYIGGKAHAGFINHANKLEDALRRDGIAMRHLVGIYGHSLGGAAAELLGMKYQVPVMTWGAPNVWCRFPRSFNRWRGYSHIRIWDRSDPVVSIPPKTFGWTNAPAECIEYGAPWWLGWWRRFLFNREKNIMRFHWMSNYLEHAVKDARKQANTSAGKSGN